MLHSVLVLFLSAQAIGPSPSPVTDDFREALAHAEALYYEAKFKDSIQLLARVDEQLRDVPGRSQERAATKLQLALSHIGLNDVDKAKAFLRELFDVEPDYQLDPQQFSPKVVALAVDAKKEENEIRCHVAGEDARKLAQGGNTGALVDLIGSMGSKCPGLSALQPEAAELLYKRGLDSYKRSDFKSALQDFRNAVKIDPKHERAAEYLGITENKLQLTADRLFLDWRKDFEARQFAEAATKYREMKEVAGPQVIEQVEAAYRDALTALVQVWNRNCPTGDTVSMERIRGEIAALLPEPSFGEDIRAQMSTCNKKTGCIATISQLAMRRLKTRINPEISRDMRNLMRDSQSSIRVKMRIDESGNVTVNDVQGYVPLINNAVRSAVERWKFLPAVDDNGPRCIDTEILMVIERQ